MKYIIVVNNYNYETPITFGEGTEHKFVAGNKK